jgi:hexosaminidase
MKRFVLAVLVSGLALSGCDDGDDGDDDADDGDDDGGMVEPAEISVAWSPSDNSVGSWMFFRSELTIRNQGPGPLPASGWRLYFSFVRRILPDGEGDDSMVQDLAGQGIQITKADKAASGDYYVLEPIAGFVPIDADEERTFDILASDWAILKTDAPAGFHISFEGAEGPVAVLADVDLDVSDPKQTTRFEGDFMSVQTAGVRHEENAALQELGVADRFLPAPRQVVVGKTQVVLSGDIEITYPAPLSKEAAYLDAALDDVLDPSRVVGPGVAIELGFTTTVDLDDDGTPDPEGYLLDVAGGQVTILGTDAAGVFYGIQTLRQLIPAEAYLAAADPAARLKEIEVPEVHIADAPGFSYRGMHLDVARHFQSVETVKKVLDLIAYYKLNKFHFHLTDDEGWRLEIPGIPELTSYSGRRGHDLDELEMLHVGLGSGNDLADGDGIEGKPASPTEANLGVVPSYQGFETATLNFVGKGSGYYTTSEFEEILAYAAERHIDVIPEIDVPGHARAAVKAMERRYAANKESDPEAAVEFRLIDPDDTSVHQSVQMYTDNFVNPCLDTSYAFLEVVVAEIQARYEAAGADLVAIHAGGDELPGLASNVWWQGSPACAANPDTKDLTDIELFNLFFTRWHAIITATGAEMTGWDDIIHNGLTLEGFLPMPWSNVWGWGREDDAYKYANQGYRVILAHATNLYMDLAYGKDPDEPGYYWANFVDVKQTFDYRPFDIFALATHDRMGVAIDPSVWAKKERLTEAGRANVIGMQGLLWGENLKSPELVEYLAFPKVLGVAERAWNPEPPPVEEMPASWDLFANSLGQEILPRLGAYRPVDLRDELPDQVGVNYRLPPPGAALAGGVLSASVQFPGLAVEYSTDEGKTWLEYSDPVEVDGRVLLRTRAPDGRTSRIAGVE